jgi:hypothetical protein
MITALQPNGGCKRASQEAEQKWGSRREEGKKECTDERKEEGATKKGTEDYEYYYDGANDSLE